MIEVFGALAEDAAATGPSQMLVIGSGLVALVLSLIVWPLVRFALTIAHEGAHAITGTIMGGKIKSIELYRKGGGATAVSSLGPLGGFFTALAGYLGPSVFGLVGAFLLAGNKITAVWWLSMVLLVLALLQAGNFVGRLAIVATIGVIVLVLRSASAGQQTFFAYVWVWFLLIGGFGHVLALQYERGQRSDTSSDAYQLRKMSFLPATLWSGFFWLITLIALLFGAAILLGFTAREG